MPNPSAVTLFGRVGPDTGYPAKCLANVDIQQITGYSVGYLDFEISRISGIWIVSISGIRPHIENGRISGPTLIFALVSLWLRSGYKKFIAFFSFSIKREN